MDALIQHNIIAKPSGIHGYGVFATKDISKDTIIEACYCLIINQYSPDLNNFAFGHHAMRLLPMGFGSIYNHAAMPNATYYYDESKKLMIFKSTKFIYAHEEIFISYGEDWFAQRYMTVKKISLLRKFLNYLKGMPLRAAIAISGLLITMYLMNVLTATMQIEKIPKILAMTTLQEKGS